MLFLSLPSAHQNPSYLAGLYCTIKIDIHIWQIHARNSPPSLWIQVCNDWVKESYCFSYIWTGLWAFCSHGCLLIRNRRKKLAKVWAEWFLSEQTPFERCIWCHTSGCRKRNTVQTTPQCRNQRKWDSKYQISSDKYPSCCMFNSNYLPLGQVLRNPSESMYRAI